MFVYIFLIYLHVSTEKQTHGGLRPHHRLLSSLPTSILVNFQFILHSIGRIPFKNVNTIMWISILVLITSHCCKANKFKNLNVTDKDLCDMALD